jgi:hypothetical protein
MLKQSYADLLSPAAVTTRTITWHGASQGYEPDWTGAADAQMQCCCTMLHHGPCLPAARPSCMHLCTESPLTRASCARDASPWQHNLQQRPSYVPTLHLC